jgi:NADH-quinone oxidoreductase subunit J
MAGEAASWIYAVSFYAIAFFAVISALVVISARNPVISAVWLVVCFISVAGIYALLKAPLLAMIQILVYAGAIMVLFVMIMMLMDIGRLPSGGKAQRVLRIFSAPIGALILLILSVVASQGSRLKGASWAQAPDGVTESIGKLLFTKYMLPFESLTLLLLAAVVAAVYLARRREADK